MASCVHKTGSNVKARWCTRVVWAGAGRGRHGVCAGALAAGEAIVACCYAWELGSVGAGLLKLQRHGMSNMHGEELKTGVEQLTGARVVEQVWSGVLQCRESWQGEKQLHGDLLYGAERGCLLGVMTGNGLVHGKREKSQLRRKKTVYWARAWKMDNQLEPRPWQKGSCWQQRGRAGRACC